MEYLRSWGCGPVEAPSGKEALSILRKSVSSKNLFNLVLTDIQMFEMNGFDLATEIRTSEALKEIPIIALTSVGMIGDGKRCRDIGIDGYLTKPIKQDDLHKSIISVLSSSKFSRGLPYQSTGGYEAFAGSWIPCRSGRERPAGSGGI
jgi:CheY-like chemotaxis protein